MRIHWILQIQKDFTVLPISQQIAKRISTEPPWLDDIIFVSKGDQVEHEKKILDVLKKLEEAGNQESERKSEFFLNKTKWQGHEVNETGIKPNEEK